MNLDHAIALANASGGTLYLMCVLLFAALTVIIERSLHLFHMQRGGQQVIVQVQSLPVLEGELLETVLARHRNLPHGSLIKAAMIAPAAANREASAGHLEEALMCEVPALDRSLWVLDTVITLAPLLGLFGTIIGMFGTFSVLGDVQGASAQVTGGIAEALIATASGLFIAMIGVLFFNKLNTKVRLIVHQLEVLKLMLLNRMGGNQSNLALEEQLKSKLKLV